MKDARHNTLEGQSSESGEHLSTLEGLSSQKAEPDTARFLGSGGESRNLESVMLSLFSPCRNL